jgi:FkbM family methyltransferase
MPRQMDKRSVGRALCVRPLTAIMGRRNFYRLALFLIREARGDAANDFATNGEGTLQETVLHTARHSPIVVFDVGANVGEWTKCIVRQARRESRALQVHAFEPCKGTFEILTQRLREGDASNVRAVNKGCSSSSGTALMTVYGSGLGINTICEPIGDNPPESASEVIQLATVDEYCRTNSISYIDLLKIDAEGHDCEVIAGATEMLSSKAIDVMQFEYNWRWIGARHYLRDVFNLLTPLGYSIGKLTSRGIEFYPEWKWEMETFWEGNYVACLPVASLRFSQIRPKWLFS